MSTVAIKGITYEVIKRDTAEDLMPKYPNTARSMVAVGIVAQLGIRRPKGRKIYLAHEYTGGHVQLVTTIGF